MPPSSSTDSLPISYRSRASVYTSSSLHTLAADTDGLHRLLATKDITTQVIAGAFEEYAWRGLLRSTRVRDWCEGLRTLLDEVRCHLNKYEDIKTDRIASYRSRPLYRLADIIHHSTLPLLIAHISPSSRPRALLLHVTRDPSVPTRKARQGDLSGRALVLGRRRRLRRGG